MLQQNFAERCDCVVTWLVMVSLENCMSGYLCVSWILLSVLKTFSSFPICCTSVLRAATLNIDLV